MAKILTTDNKGTLKQLIESITMESLESAHFRLFNKKKEKSPHK